MVMERSCCGHSLVTVPVPYEDRGDGLSSVERERVEKRQQVSGSGACRQPRALVDDGNIPVKPAGIKDRLLGCGVIFLG